MQDMDDDQIMTDFLLGTLDEKTRSSVFDRLGADDGFVERMAAMEDDLILRWHRGQLPARQQELFERAYAEPSRRARVDSAITLIQAAEAWKANQEAGVWNRIARWAGTPWISAVPRWAIAAVGIVLLTSLGAYLSTGERSAATPPPFTATFILTAVGERGSSTAKGFDSVSLPPNATAVELVVEPSGVTAEGRFTAEIAAVDRGTILEVNQPSVRRSAAGPTLTITVASSELPDGDYVLTVRHVTTGGSEVVSRQPFRVVRQPN